MTENVDSAPLRDRAHTVRGKISFIARSDGSVIVCSLDGRSACLLDAPAWASTVALMSAHGDSARAFALAERFHGGRWTEARGHP